MIFDGEELKSFETASPSLLVSNGKPMFSCGFKFKTMNHINMNTLTAENFDETVLKADLPFLVDFWATWCGPCKAVGPVLEELSTEYAGKMLFGKINTDEQSLLSAKFDIRGIPTMIIFSDGKEITKKVGFSGKSDLKDFIEGILK